MKAHILSLMVSAVLSCQLMSAGVPVVERTYISTDRQIYVAGDEILCSAFCMDVTGEAALSEVSSIAYVEMHSAEGLACTAKIALVHGRGAGSIQIPKTLPTGNYKLIAYTALNRYEEGYDYGRCGKTVSIFNPFLTGRVKDGVAVVTDEEYSSATSTEDEEDDGIVSISASGQINPGGGMTVRIHNTSSEAVTLSVSVTLDDGIDRPGLSTVHDFYRQAENKSPVTYASGCIPEYEGEIIEARVVGIDPANIHVLDGKFAFISAPGDKSDVYATAVRPDGTMLFFTNNIYGDKDLVCEMEGIGDDTPCHIELISPFASPDIQDIPRLRLCPAIEGDVTRRSVSSQIERSFANDTLYEYLPVRENLLFRSDGISYKLDDYTRFPLMSEVLTEFVTELRSRKDDDGKREIKIRYDIDPLGSPLFSKNSSLVMLDGVPVFDHQKILDYDPLLVESINIYGGISYIGNRGYEGIANFVTYKQNLPSMNFGDNVRVYSFQGAGIPAARTYRSIPDGYPDYRTTLYWHPVIRIEAGGDTSFECTAPCYHGAFDIIVEGFDGNGKPVRSVSSFKVD